MGEVQSLYREIKLTVARNVFFHIKNSESFEIYCNGEPKGELENLRKDSG